MHVADKEVPRLREALRELGVDELVDHDPRCDDTAGQPVAEDCGDDDEPGQPGPNRHARKLAPLRRRSRLRPAVACQSDVVELTGELGGERRPRLDTDLGGRLRDLGDDCVGDPGPAGGLFERRRIVLGNTAEVVLTLNVGARGIAHRELCRLARGEQLERRRKRRDLVFVDGHLQCHIVWQLREPAEIADDQRPSE